MLTSLKARWRTSPPSASQALYGGMLAMALFTVLLLISFRACAPSSVATQQHLNQPAIAFTLSAEKAGVQLPTPITYTPAPGHPTLLVFFYTLCTHCLLQVQSAQQVASGFAGLHIVYIDSPGERANLPDLTMHRLGITDPVLLDSDGRVAARYGIAYYPAFVLVDGHGIVRDIWTGETDATTMRTGISQTLAADGSR